MDVDTPKVKKPRKPKPSELLNTPLEEARQRILGMLSTLQQSFLLDAARFKVARCGRRGGKTYVDAAGLVYYALLDSNVSCVYFGLTSEAAKEAVWEPLLHILSKAGIAHTYSEHKLEVTIGNGSRIKLLGADMANIPKRLRGRKFRLVIVDECAFYTSVDNLILKVLVPATSDYKAPIWMTSSPGELAKGLFYQADQGDRKAEWAQYHWTLLDNPFYQGPADNPEKFKSRGEEELDTICRMVYQGDWNNPIFRREYLGEWQFNERSLAYPLQPEHVLKDELYLKAPQFAIGLNLSHVGRQAAVVVKYGEYSREVQVVRAYEFQAASLTELAAEIDQLREDYDVTTPYCYLGTLDESVLENFRARYKIPMLANQHDKSPYYQKLISTDIGESHIFVQASCTELIKSFNTVVKDDDGEEIAGQDTLLTDAFFSVYLNIYNTHLKAVDEPETEEDKMERELIESVQRELEEHSDDYGYN